MDTANLTGQIGDNLSTVVRVSDVDINGVARPRPLGGATLRARVRYGNDPQSDLAPDNLRAVVEDPAQGIVLVSLPMDHLLPAGFYYYEIDLAQGTGNETILHGRLTIEPTLF